MTSHGSDDELELTEDQIVLLRDLGVEDVEGMSISEAQALIDELQSEREAARLGNV